MMLMPRRVALTCCILASLAASSDAIADQVHTSLSEFDACQPLTDGRVVAGSGGGLVIVGKNGAEERRLTALDGLPGTKVHALAQDGDVLWVGTDSGVARLQILDDRVKLLSSVKTKAVRDILIENDSVLLATWGQGLLRVTNSGTQVVHAGDSPRAKRITALERHDNRLWWTTAGAGIWSMSEKGIVRQSSQIRHTAVLWALQAHQGELWVGGERGSMRLGLPRSTSRSVRSYASSRGELLAASFGEGLRAVAGQNLANSPGDRFARSVGANRSLVCLGTQSALWIRRDAKWKKARLTTGLPANDIAAFVTNEQRSYIGTFDAGVAELINGRARPLDIEIDPHINALAIDKSDGALWIGTSSGLTRYRERVATRFTKATGLPSAHVMSLSALHDGGVLVGTAAGAARVDNGMVRPIGGKGRLQTGNVWAVAEGLDGSQWLGTTRGVFHVRGTRVDRYRVASGELPDDWVMALAVADDGVFVGTYKTGVVRLVTTGQTVTAKRLGDGWVNPSGLHWDGSVLRAATMHGAFRGDGVSDDWASTTQGLGRDTTAFLPSSPGSEWIVTRRGLEERNYASRSK